MKDHFWQGKRVLVTGANGFLAGWLIMFLLREGAEIVGIVRCHRPKSNFCLSGLDRLINIVQGSMTDYRTVERALNDYDIEIVFHLAAQAIVGVAHRSPISTFINNIVATLNLLEAVRQIGCVKRVVIASSDKVYGDQRLPYTENSPMLSQYPYDVSKTVTELVTKSYHETYFKDGNPKVFVGVARCANLFGGGDLNFTRIIPRQMHKALRGESLAYNLCVRQFLYILDAVQSYLSLAEKLDRKSIDGEAFNFGTGKGISMKDLVREHILGICHNGEKLSAYQRFYSPDGKSMIETKSSQKPEGYLDYPAREIRGQFMDCEKAFQLLGWKSVYSLLEGIEDTWYWYQSWFSKKDIRVVNEELVERFIEKREVQSSDSAPPARMQSAARVGKPRQLSTLLSLHEV